MPINLVSWRARIGVYNIIKIKVSKVSRDTSFSILLTLFAYIISYRIKLCCSLMILFTQIFFTISFLTIFVGSSFLICYIFSSNSPSLCKIFTDIAVFPILFLKPSSLRNIVVHLLSDMLRYCIVFYFIHIMLLLLSGDIELNPGPKN